MANNNIVYAKRESERAAFTFNDIIYWAAQKSSQRLYLGRLEVSSPVLLIKDIAFVIYLIYLCWSEISLSLSIHVINFYVCAPSSQDFLCIFS